MSGANLALVAARVPPIVLLILLSLYISNIAGELEKASYGIEGQRTEIVATSAAAGITSEPAADKLLLKALSDKKMAVLFESARDGRLSLGIFDPLDRFGELAYDLGFPLQSYSSDERTVTIRPDSALWNLNRTDLHRILGTDKIAERSNSISLPPGIEFTYTLPQSDNVEGRYLIVGDSGEIQSFMQTLIGAGYSVTEVQQRELINLAFNDRAGVLIALMCAIVLIGANASWISVIGRDRLNFKKMSMIGARPGQGGLSVVGRAASLWLIAAIVSCLFGLTVYTLLVNTYGVELFNEALVSLPILVGADLIGALLLAFLVGSRFTRLGA